MQPRYAVSSLGYFVTLIVTKNSVDVHKGMY